jgi:hypothetical protein
VCPLPTHKKKSSSTSGRSLTRALQATLSFHQWDMSDETLLVQHIKEQCCFVPAAYGNASCRPDVVVGKEAEKEVQRWSFKACEWACR